MTKLTTKVLRRSKGDKIGKGDTLLVWYEGNLAKSGTRFDGNYDFKTFEVPYATPTYLQLGGSFVQAPRAVAGPFEFVVGKGTVIPGWEQTFKKGRRLGEVIDVTIPADLAYKEQGSTNVPPNSDLRFKIEVLGALPKGGKTGDAKFPQLKHYGVNTSKLGLSSKELEQLNSSKIGLDGKDQLIGDNSKDLLVGLGGNDKLEGAAGADVLIGGSGKNRFVYTDINDSPAGKGEQDSIYGFSKKDTINLRGLDGELSYIGAKKFSGAAGDVRFKKGILELDQDGDGSADFAIALPGTSALKDSQLLL